MKTKINKIITGIALTMTVITTLSSCKKDEDENKNLKASINVVNSVEGSTAQDAYVDDSKATTSPVAYGSASGSLNIATGNRTIVFKNAGTSTLTASAGFNAELNSSTTVFLVKKADGSYGINTYANDNTTVSGKARVRFVNVAPLLSAAINVTTSAGTAVVNGLTYTAASAYQTVDANTAFNITMAGSLEVTTISSTELQAGKNYIVWFDSSSSTKAKYHVVLQN